MTIFITSDTGPRKGKQYLGDGAYVDHDSCQVWVWTECCSPMGDGPVREEVALGQDELQRLVDYARRLGMEIK